MFAKRLVRDWSSRQTCIAPKGRASRLHSVHFLLSDIFNWGYVGKNPPFVRTAAFVIALLAARKAGPVFEMPIIDDG